MNGWMKVLDSFELTIRSAQLRGQLMETKAMGAVMCSELLEKHFELLCHKTNSILALPGRRMREGW